MPTRFVVGLCLLLWLPTRATRAQTSPLTFRKLSTKDGLLSNFVSGVATDTKGYLWVATRRGLCRYDGYEFQSHPGNQTGGSAESICALPNGSLAVHWGLAGLFIVDGTSGAVTTIDSVNFKDADPVNDAFKNLFADSKGNLWSSSFGLIRRFELGSRQKHQYAIARSGPAIDANHFFEDRQHRVWVVGERGLYWFDAERDTLRCQIGPTAAAVSFRLPTPFSCLTQAPDGSLWIGTTTGVLIRYQPGAADVQRFSVPGDIQSLAFVMDASGNHALWLGCRDGLRLFQPTSGTVTNVPELLEQGVSIPQIQINPRKSITWLATSDGLWQYRVSPAAIQPVRLPEAVVRHPVVVKSILEGASDAYWLGLSHTGTLYWNRTTNAFRLFRYPVEATTNALARVDGTLWAATSNGIFALQAGGFQPVQLPNRFSSAAIRAVLADRQNRLWVLHETEGIQVFDRTTRRPLQLWNERQARDLWTTNRYHDITQSADGRIWIAAWYPKSFGMIGYNERERRLQELAEFNKHNRFVGDYFNRVSAGRQGRLLFSGGGGINVTDAGGRIDPDRSVYSDKMPQLADDFCVGVAEDSQGILWTGTGEGLHAYDAKTRLIRRFGEFDGLLADDVTNGFFMTSTDLLLLGQQNGLDLVDLRLLRQPKRLPPLSLSGMMVNGQFRSVDARYPLVFGHAENNLRFTFTTLEFSPPSSTHFRYKLTDSPSWTDLNTTNELNLVNLKSGVYTLIVENGDATDHWNPNAVTIRFTVSAAWYETGWFRGLVLFALLGVLYGFYRLRIGQERRRSELTRQRAEAETRALRAQMNPHFIFNCMNTIDAYILTNRPEAASVFLQKFSRLVRQVLENSRETLIPVAQEIGTLKLYVNLEEERADHRFSCQFLVAPDAETCLLPPLLLQPFVENAILHGLRHKTNGPGHLTIQIWRDETHLFCRIDDDGIGRTRAAAINQTGPSRQSLGSTVTTERIDSLRTLYGSEASCTITDRNPADGTGTVVDIRLPLLR